MRTEQEFSSFIQRRLIERGIIARLEGTNNAEIAAALRDASKNLTGNAGYPDIVAVVKDFVLIMENKSDYAKLELKDGTKYVSNADAIKNYAVNGALFYARKIFEATHYTKIFAFGNAGDETHHNFKPVFLGEGKDKKTVLKEFKTVEVFENFTAENIDAYYRREILEEELPEDKELKKVIKYAGNLHERLRNYGQLGETEKPLVVSGIILAMDDGLTLDELKGTPEETLSDGAVIFYHIVNRLNTADIQPEVKKERVLAQFQLIKNRPLLNAIHPRLDKTPLKFFAEYIQDNIYAEIKKSGSIDYLGKFYREFVSYSGGDGQTLGVVLTPEHITELFCDLVDLKADDVVLDPCCGTGGFLLAAMDRMLNLAENDEQRQNIKKNQLHGVEVRDDMFSIATTSMILRGDGKSNLICADFFAKTAADFAPAKFTVGFMNPPYSQAKNSDTNHLSELNFIEHLLDCMTTGARVAVIVPVSAMIGKTKGDKISKREILKHHSLQGVISLNKNTFYQIGTVPCIAVFTAGVPHKPGDIVKFINFEDDGFELRKHEGYKPTADAPERKKYLLECWRGNIAKVPSKFMVKTEIEPDDEWLHSFYYYNDELPAEQDFLNTIADYLTFEFNMIVHGRAYLFNRVKKKPLLTENLPPLEKKIWKMFDLAQIFSIRATASGIDKNKLTSTAGQIPYITRTDRNNGVQDFIGEQENFSLDGKNCITVGLDTQTAFYQPADFYTGQNIQILKNDKLNVTNAKFLLPLIKKTLSIFSWGGNGATLTRLKRSKIQLPVNNLGEPDFEYMESYIALREEKLIRQYLDSISTPPHCRIVPLNEKIWGEFLISDLFEVFLPSGDTQADNCDAGKIPLISAGFNNNGVCKFIERGDDKSEIYGGNIISVDMFGKAFFHEYKFYSVSHGRINLLKPLKNLNRFHLQFLTLAINESAKNKFSYNQMCSSKRVKKLIVQLPVNETGEPDFEYMERYSRNLFAQVIKKYLDVI